MIFSAGLFFIPSNSKTENTNLTFHILILSISILVINIILFGFSDITIGSIFLILAFLLILFIIDIFIFGAKKLIKFLCSKYNTNLSNNKIILSEIIKKTFCRIFLLCKKDVFYTIVFVAAVSTPAYVLCYLFYSEYTHFQF